MGKRRKPQKASGNGVRLWGRHAILAALGNPEREVRKIWGTREALAMLDLPPVLPIVYCDVADLGKMVPFDAPHQGLVADAEPLDDMWLGDVIDEERDSFRPLIVLDQVTDPHNVGAIFRSAAAFDAAAVITQDRHAPLESGALAKAASGALEFVPWVRVVNLARALDEIADAGYWRIGLDGDTEIELGEAMGSSKVALVMGAEGEGLRANVAAHCDTLARIAMSPRMESLNVSNAAAIALHSEYIRRPGEES